MAIGGGISKRPELLMGIRAALDDLMDHGWDVYDPNMPKAVVVNCAYSSEANLIGAYYFFMQQYNK